MDELHPNFSNRRSVAEQAARGASGHDDSWHGEDEPTLRALEGLPSLDRTGIRAQQVDIDMDSSDDEDGEITHATLISFDVEATEVAETSAGTWSAELRSANEAGPSKDIVFRMTAITMLPPLLAADILSAGLAGVILMPLEAVMVRVVARAYRESAGLGVDDFYAVGGMVSGIGNLFSGCVCELAAAGLVWAGITVIADWLCIQDRNETEGRLVEE
jgi:hypothetical protein